ncbi:ras association domain-containing protein 9 isoform X2 [Thalassophryne amazonica]|uniref:ras association domain-containing protein 9 isoform X1 n=1 Tax=Thalassophryne amazonica TaxID=390379 RepID=UPI00147110B2|nr:ras association domain-containing protein 9 isoform X1 [Thalassophryne amazonica]XP_034031796.1 ras association domain-containing protein 9 isoform X2 [Thalassophryne amazonica]
MAPFGRNFIKARLKNRAKEEEPVVGKEIQVTMCNEEKVVCGVTKHTTCADMVQALLEDHKTNPEAKRLLHGDPSEFCLVERWKGFERALPPLTRILRLWYAWGDQRPFIQFVLVKTSNFVPQAGRKVGKSKGAKPKRLVHSQAQPAYSIPAEKQKRMVFKAFRKLEKIHKKSRSSPESEQIDQMVQLILTQDYTIREQIQQMRELDMEIEQFELQKQREADPESSPTPENIDGCCEEQLLEYLYTSDGVKELDLQVQRHQNLILQLSQDIDAELRANLAFLLSQDEEIDQEEGAAGGSWIPCETDPSFYAAELEMLQSELNYSLFAGVSLHNQAAEVDKQLRHYNTTLVSKDQECRQLASQLSLLRVTDNTEETSCSSPPKTETQCSVSETVKLKHNMDGTDTDSDTGISSTHSQDSLSPCLDFPPPLDTDV